MAAPAGENLLAFDSRFAITCRKRPGSTSTSVLHSGSGVTKCTLSDCAKPALSSSERFTSSLTSMRRTSKRCFSDSSFSMSRMSLISSVRRSQLFKAMLTRPAARSGSLPATPADTRPSEPRIEVSGVRSSCETVATNSFFMRSTR